MTVKIENIPMRAAKSLWIVGCVRPYGRKPLYAFCSALQNGTGLNEAFCNSHFVDALKINITECDIEIVMICPNEADARQKLSLFIIEHQCPSNIHGRQMETPANRRSGRIRRVDDGAGTEYENAYAVCKAFGLNSGNLSRHLNGQEGHKTILGMRFERIGS